MGAGFSTTSSTNFGFFRNSSSRGFDNRMPAFHRILRLGGNQRFAAVCFFERQVGRNVVGGGGSQRIPVIAHVLAHAPAMFAPISKQNRDGIVGMARLDQPPASRQ